MWAWTRYIVRRWSVPGYIRDFHWFFFFFFFTFHFFVGQMLFSSKRKHFFGCNENYRTGLGSIDINRIRCALLPLKNGCSGKLLFSECQYTLNIDIYVNSKVNFMHQRHEKIGWKHKNSGGQWVRRTGRQSSVTQLHPVDTEGVRHQLVWLQQLYSRLNKQFSYSHTLQFT